jgi:glycosyltransferase involved in cell wall biosynthesis
MKVMFFITDCRSFNELCEGQFEFFCSRYPEVEFVFLAGRNASNEVIFRKRNVGRLVTFPIARAPMPSDIFAIVRIFATMLRERPNVIVCSTPKAFVFGAICGRLAGVQRRIGIVRGFRQENMGGIRRRIFNFLDVISMRCLTDVIYISRSLQEIYHRELGENSNEICIMSSNGLPASRYFDVMPSANERKKLRAGYNFTDQNFVCIVVGRICREKGVVEFSEILDRLPSNTNLRFLFVGAPDDAFGENFTQKYGRDQRVVFAGEHRHLANLYSVADLHLFLTHREGFGNVAMEAAANGVPTIAYNVTGVRDSVKAGVSGLLVPRGDIVQVLNIINELHEASAKGECLFPDARDWALKNFKQTDIWCQYADIIF